MSVRTSLLPVFDTVRTLLDTTLGLRTTTVTLRTETWSGGEVGKGTKTIVDQPITPRPKVVDTGNGDYAITKITPAWVQGLTTGGWALTTLFPVESPTGTIVYLILLGPDGFARDANIVDVRVRKNFEYQLLAHDRR